MRGPAKRSRYRYAAVELLAVIEVLGGKRRAHVVLDITTVEPKELTHADYNLFKEKLMARIRKISTPSGNIP